MTDRERWTVYPLLFLTMGIAIKDKLGPLRVDDVYSKAVFCQELVVTDAQGREQVVLAANENGGFVRTVGNKSGLRTVLGHMEGVGGLVFVDREDRVHPGSLYATPTPQTPPVESDDAQQP